MVPGVTEDCEREGASGFTTPPSIPRSLKLCLYPASAPHEGTEQELGFSVTREKKYFIMVPFRKKY